MWMCKLLQENRSLYQQISGKKPNAGIHNLLHMNRCLELM